MEKKSYTTRMNVKRLVLGLVAICISAVSFSQAVTNTGKEFWVGYGHHQYMESSCDGATLGDNTMNMRVYLSNTSNQVAHVTLTLDSSNILPNSLPYTKTYNINPNSVIETENMPKGAIDATTTNSNSDPNFDARLWTDAPPAGTGGEGHFRKKGIHIVSDVPIVAYAHIYGGVSSGATMLLPIEAWGYSYTSINSEQGGGVTGCYSWMYVIAKEDNTIVEITPSVPTRLGRPAWVPFRDTLMKGQIYQMVGQADCATGSGVQLTGTRIKSVSGSLGDCKAIAVFSGSSRTGGEAALCGGSGRDNDMQQCYPQQAWGTRYITSPFASASGSTLRPTQPQPSVYKVVVKDPSTAVKRNGVLMSTSIVSVSAIASATSICPGTSVQFTAIPVNGGDVPTYQWKINGNDAVGAINAVYITDTLNNNDKITCTIGSNATCAVVKTATTPSPINITVANKTVAEVTIFSTSESDCGSNPIEIKAVPKNGGAVPSYQWVVNGSNVGSPTTNDTYPLTTSAPGTRVECIMTSNAGCLLKAADTSNLITLTAAVSITPSVVIEADVDVTKPICPNTQVTFTATPTNGGSVPTYQWQINGSNATVGVSSGNTYTINSNAFAFNDQITCLLTSSAPCANPATSAPSNTLAVLNASNSKAITAQFVSSSSSLCGSGTTKFFAIPTANAGNAPTYQWTVNDISQTAATTDSTFAKTGLQEGDVVKCIITSNASCVSFPVKTFGVVTMGTPNLINKSYYIYLSSTADYIEADKAIVVAQYMSNGGNCGSTTNSEGDPEMVFLSPIDQAIKKAAFYSTNLQNINSNFINVILPTSALSSLRINNSNVFNHIYAVTNKPGFSIAIKGWTAEKKQWIVTCDSGFNAITYGLGGAESYAYNAGTNLNNIDGLPAYHNLPDTSGLTVSHPYTYVGSPMILRANIAFRPNKMVWQLSYLGCSVVTPCADITVNNPVPSDSVTIGTAKYYQYICPNPASPNNEYVFNIPGTYNLPIELSANNIDNANCSNKEVVNPEILVKYKPSMQFNYTQAYGCGVDTVRFQADTITPELYKIIKYKWRFTNTPADTSNLRNPSFYFSTPGVYPVRLSVITINGGIADTTINITVTSGSKAHSNFGANPSTICLGEQIKFVDSTSYFQTDYWYWDFGNGYKDTVNNNLDRYLNPYTVPGTYLVKHTLMGSTFPCLPDTVTRIVIVATTSTNITATPVSPTNCITGTDGKILVGNLSPNTPHSLSYIYGGNPFTVTATSDAIGVATIPNLTTGTYTNIVATIGSCSSSPVGPVTIVDPAGPAQPTIAPANPFCEGQSIILSASTATTGATFTWTGPSSYTATGATITRTNATTAMAGGYSVVAQANNCTSAPENVTVVVNAIPVITNAIPSDASTCSTATGSINLTGLIAGNVYTVSYTFNSATQTVTLTANSSNEVLIPNLLAGIYTNITAQLGSCVSQPKGPVTVSDPTPPAKPVASVLTTPICAGQTIDLSATSATTGVTFEWTGPNSFTGTGSPLPIPNATVAATGNYTVIAKLGNCTSAVSDPINVVVNAIPGTPSIASNSPICAGSTLTITSSGVTGSAVYNFTGPNSFSSSGSSSTATISSATVAASGNYSLTVTQNGCSSAPSSPLNVTVNAVPVISNPVLVNTTSCTVATGTITMDVSQSNTAFTVTYTANSTPQTASITSASNGTLTIANLSAGTYSNIQVSVNNCSSNVLAGPFTINNPTPPAAPSISSNNSPVCSGNPIVITASSADASAQFTWTTPAGSNVTGATLTIPNAASTDGGSYTVKVTVNGCSSSVTPTSVTVNQTPSFTATKTDPINCTTNTGTIVLNGLQPSTAYTITYTKNTNPVSVGLSSNAGGSLTITGLGAGNYANIVATLNGCSSTGNVSFTLSDPLPPAVPTITPNPSATICAGSNTTLTASTSTTGTITYNWTATNGFTYAGNPVSITNAAATNAGTYNVTATQNSCTSAPASITVVVNPTPTISLGSIVNPSDCNGTNGSIAISGLQANNVYTVNYSKAGSAQTATLTANAGGIVTIASLSAASYTNLYVVTSAGCQSNTIAGPVTLTDPPIPVVSITSNNSPLCEGNTLSIVSSSSLAGSTFTWTSNSPVSYIGAGNIVTIGNTVVGNSGDYTVIATKNSCVSVPVVTSVSIRPTPKASFAVPTFVCMPNGSVYFTNQSTVSDNGTLSYLWNFGDGNTSADVNATHVYGSSSTYQVKLTATAGVCSKDTTIPFSAFYDKPVAAFKADKDTICQGVLTKFTDLSTAPNSTITSWTWDFGDGSSPSTLANPSKMYGLPNQYDVKLVVKNAQGCTSDVLEKTIKVYLQPKIDAGMSFIVPQGTTVVFNPTTNDSTTVTFAWTPAADFANPNILRPSLLVLKNQTYTVTATGLGNCQATDTLRVVALKPFIIPNAFSPNGDNINDKWNITNLEDYSFATVEVFNRAGQLVYKSYGYSFAWDGTRNGQPLPIGVYYYIIDFKNAFPRMSGYVTILR